MLTHEEHQALSLRIQMLRFWVECIANLNLVEHRENVVLIHWEVLEIAKILHPEVLLVR